MKTPKTNKGAYNAIIRKAEKLAAQLEQLQKKAQELAEMCQEFGECWDYDSYIYELAELERTADELANFDLVDSIPEPARVNF